MTKLKNIAGISSGYSFRGRIPEQQDGEVSVIQMKDVSMEEGIKSDAVIKTALPGKREPDFLRSGDILFVARGSHHYAALYSEQFDKAVAAPHFFVIRIKSPRVIPEFIAWQLNQHSAQRYFEKESEGSVAKSIKRTSLEQLPISLPSTKQQQSLLRLYKNLSEQKRVYHALVMNAEKLMRAIAGGLGQDFNKVIMRSKEQ